MSWATGYQWAWMHHLDHELGEKHEVTDMDEELHRDNHSLFIPSWQRTVLQGEAQGAGPAAMLTRNMQTNLRATLLSENRSSIYKKKK